MKNLLIAKLILFNLFIFGNVANAFPVYTDDNKPGAIKGVIVDKATGQAMEYANIAIYNKADSMLVTGGITKNNGEFEISGMPLGEYYLEAHFIGFVKSKVTNIVIDKENPLFNSGSIKLSPSAIEIGSVDVVADKAAVEYKLDKKVINVSQVISAAGGSAANVLENTPSVQVDIEGNVTLRGSGSFTVLIDGRPSVLSGSDALRQIPASALDNIEIITNPSAKYEPDGSAGIINLIMKKNSMNGLSGIINGTIGTGDKYRGDFLLNYRTEKFNYFLGADWRDETNYGSMASSRETYLGDTTNFLSIGGDRDFIRGGQNFKGGFDFYLSDKTTFTLSGEVGKSKNNRSAKEFIHEYNVPQSFDIYSVNDEISASENDFFSGTFNFQHKFKEEGHKIEANAFYSGQNGFDSDKENEMLTDENYNPSGTYLAQVKAYEDEDEKELRLKADYTLPFSKVSKLEAGFQSRIEREQESTTFEEYDPVSGTWITSDFFSSAIDFKNDIHAVYATYSNKLGGLEFMGGLRGELTDREIKSSANDSVATLKLYDLFPTLHLSYDIGEKNEIMASYSRRINRPGGWDLNVVPTYFNRYTIREGNPELEPEYTDSYDLGYMMKFGRSYLSLEAFNRITKNKIERIETLGDDGILYLKSENSGKDYSTGLELMGNVEFTKWLTVNASISGFKYRLQGDIDGEAFDRESTNWSGRMNTTIKFSDNSRMQIQGFYRGPSVSAQGESKASFYTTLALKQDFLKKKLTATLTMQDPFGTANFERESVTESFKSWFEMKREPRVLMLTLSYKINNFKSDERGGGSGGGNMDMGGGEM
ncbi:MAG: outer membrane beta-barrel family protein [Draconibacterium sp.]|nr:outer membrane beta-barrel family protein [Draconibacterium sp.]